MMLLALLLVGNMSAQAKDHIKKVNFSHKEPTARFQGAVVRADRDVYVFNAEKGQRLIVKLSSQERNGALTVTRMGVPEAIGGTVEESEKGFVWSGDIPQAGAYQVELSGTRGNLNYDVEFMVI